MIRFSKTEWALLLCSLIVIIALAGCGHRGSLLASPGSAAASLPEGPSGILASLALWVTWAAGVGLLACGVAAIFLPNKLGIAKVAIGCLAALLVAGILAWISAHWAIIMGLCAGVLVLAGIGYLYVHRAAIEKAAAGAIKA